MSKFFNKLQRGHGVKTVFGLAILAALCMFMLPVRAFGGEEFREKLQEARQQVQRPARGWIIGNVAQEAGGLSEWNLKVEEMGTEQKKEQSADTVRQRPRPRHPTRPDNAELEELRAELNKVIEENGRNMDAMLEIIKSQSNRQRDSESKVLKLIEGVAGFVTGLGALIGVLKGGKYVKKRRENAKMSLWG